MENLLRAINELYDFVYYETEDTNWDFYAKVSAARFQIRRLANDQLSNL